MNSKVKTYTKAEMDMAYIVGALNAGGVDGLHKELDRLKKFRIKPHELIGKICEANRSIDG